MIKVVLDANVLVSGLISRKGPPGQILDSWIDGHIQICYSPQILEELKRVLCYPRIQERLEKNQVEAVLELILTDAELIEGELKLKVLTRDPSDNIYLACAVEARSDYLITGNRDHFEEAGKKYRGVSIITPRAFLDILETE